MFTKRTKSGRLKREQHRLYTAFGHRWANFALKSCTVPVKLGVSNVSYNIQGGTVALGIDHPKRKTQCRIAHELCVCSVYEKHMGLCIWINGSGRQQGYIR